MFSSGFAGLALGVARGLLEALITLAKDKSPRGLKQTMRDSAVVQSEVAELEARLRATRYYLLGTLAEVWDAAVKTNQLTVDHRMAIRLASSRTIHESRDVANACYHAAGATAIFILVAAFGSGCDALLLRRTGRPCPGLVPDAGRPETSYMKYLSFTNQIALGLSTEQIASISNRFVQSMNVIPDLMDRTLAHINTAAFANRDPTTAVQFAISCADGI